MSEQTDPRIEYLLRLGDNALILSHRLSEWCGHGPVLEEDLALTNVALDLIGQAQFWLGYAGELEGKGRDADALAYKRDVWDFRNVILVEQPNGDYAHTMARQLYFDAWHFHLLSALTGSSDPRIAEIAAKALKEVTYHLERSTMWVVTRGWNRRKSRAHAARHRLSVELYRRTVRSRRSRNHIGREGDRSRPHEAGRAVAQHRHRHALAGRGARDQRRQVAVVGATPRSTRS